MNLTNLNFGLSLKSCVKSGNEVTRHITALINIDEWYFNVILHSLINVHTQ